MTWRRSNFFNLGGTGALVLGVCLQHWLHGHYGHFTGGFLLGVSIALLMLARPPRGVCG
jgi:hypothetical protein